MILYLLAYLGGILTILSPCILPVLPFVLARSDRPFISNGLPMLGGMALAFTAIASLAAVGGEWAVSANSGARIFEVIVYNQRVRDAVNLGEHHPQYDDDWAENRYVEVKAVSPTAARRKLASRYPKHLGFVIVDVIDPSSKFDE